MCACVGSFFLLFTFHAISKYMRMQTIGIATAWMATFVILLQIAYACTTLLHRARRRAAISHWNVTREATPCDEEVVQAKIVDVVEDRTPPKSPPAYRDVAI